MSGLRNRLVKLERAAAETLANCPGCVPLPARFITIYPHNPPPTKFYEEHRVRCDVCGRERVAPKVILRIVGPENMMGFHLRHDD